VKKKSLISFAKGKEEASLKTVDFSPGREKTPFFAEKGKKRKQVRTLSGEECSSYSSRGVREKKKESVTFRDGAKGTDVVHSLEEKNFLLR